jgi:hypothetical protein
LTKISLSQGDAEKGSIAGSSTQSANGRLDGLSHQMLAVLKKAEGTGIAWGIIISVLSQRNHAAPMVFLSFPLCFPVGIPLFSTALGLVLGLVGFLMTIRNQ